jgi:predicted dehydrogenase
MTELGIGVVGAGRIAQAAHLPALARATGVRLAALCDPSAYIAGELARRHGVPGYETPDELFADPSVDAVIVAVPDRLHRAIGEAALRAGKHVLVEKPLAAAVDDAELLAKTAAETGLHLQVGAMKRYDPGVQYAAAAIRESIGRIFSASIWYRVMGALRPPTEATLFPALVVDEEVRAREATFKADRVGYLLTTHGAHVLDGLRYLVGDPTTLCAQRAQLGTDCSWHGLARLEEGGLAQFEITASVHGEWAEGADIYGEHGSVRLRTHFPFALRASDVEVFDEATRTNTRPVFGDTNPYERQLEAFAQAIRTGAPDSPSADDGLAAVRLIDVVRRSVDEGGAWLPA